MFEFAFVSYAAAGQPLSISGTLSQVAAGSPVTSATCTIVGSGTLLFDSVFTDSGTPQYELAGGSWTNITEGLTLAVSAGQTFRVRAALLSGEGANFNVKNNASSVVLEAVSLDRT